MKNKWHDIIRKRLVSHRKECLKCLYPKEGYEWGCLNPKNVHKTVGLLNKILKGIPTEAWPKYKENEDSREHKIASNNWTIRLMYEEGCRHADLRFANDDHTAWVKEHSKDHGRFVNFDIGGS